MCLNAGAALWIAGRAGSLKVGVESAKNLLASGEVRKWLKRAQDYFQDVKR